MSLPLLFLSPLCLSDPIPYSGPCSLLSTGLASLLFLKHTMYAPGADHLTCCFFCLDTLKTWPQDLPGGPVVKNPPSSAGDVGQISGPKTKIPHAAGKLSLRSTTTEPAHCNKRSHVLHLRPNTAKQTNKTKAGTVLFKKMYWTPTSSGSLMLWRLSHEGFLDHLFKITDPFSSSTPATNPLFHCLHSTYVIHLMNDTLISLFLSVACLSSCRVGKDVSLGCCWIPYALNNPSTSLHEGNQK